jgi:hypothetical protein
MLPAVQWKIAQVAVAERGSVSTALAMISQSTALAMISQSVVNRVVVLLPGLLVAILTKVNYARVVRPVLTADSLTAYVRVGPILLHSQLACSSLSELQLFQVPLE